MIAIMSELSDLLARHCGKTRSLDKGRVLFRRGDPVAFVHLVDAGEIILERTAPNGVRLVLQRARAGDVLAEASIFATQYHCDAVVSENAEVRLADIAVFRRAINDDAQEMGVVAAHLARQAQSARFRAEILALRRTDHRLDAWLDLNAGRQPAKGQWRELAAELGVTPEALYRELAKRERTVIQS
jgi:CRP-like cAMP-binding protein